MASTKPRRQRARKRPGEPTKPAGSGPSMKRQGSLKPPEWLDALLAEGLPHGRPGGSKWSEQVMDTLVGVVASTGSVDIAVGLAGISSNTFRIWLHQGREDQRAWEQARAAGQDPGEPTEWHQFARAISFATGAWMGDHVAALQRMAREDGTSPALGAAIRQWLLTRLGTRLSERQEHDVAVTGSAETADVAQAMRERFDQIRERAAQATAGDAGDP